MSKLVRFFVRYPFFQTVVLLAGLVVWTSAGILDPHLAQADGICGHYCADTYSNGYDAVCATCGCAAGAGFVPCVEGVNCGDPNKCVYCCYGCVPPPGAPPGANGCWSAPNCAVYDPPSLSPAATWQPNFPLVVGQKRDSRLTVLFAARGGASQTCADAPPANLTELRVVRVDLSPVSRAWITQQLSRAYPGAYIKGLYPLSPTPATAVTGLNTGNAAARMSFPPQDPGWYEILVRTTQSDGQTAQRTYRVPAYLLGATLIR